MLNDRNMKQITLTLVLAAFTITALANDKYQKAMLKNIPSVYAAKTLEDHQKVINNLMRIAEAEADKWEPYYYISYSYIFMSFKEEGGGKKDQHLDLAQEALDKGVAIAPKESELITLQGFIHTARLSVDPMTRGAEYSSVAMQTLNESLKLNPENPRTLLLMGQMMFGTAEFMGDSTAPACELIGKSLDKFKTFTPSNPLEPQWGEAQAENALEACDK